MNTDLPIVKREGLPQDINTQGLIGFLKGNLHPLAVTIAEAQQMADDLHLKLLHAIRLVFVRPLPTGGAEMLDFSSHPLASSCLKSEWTSFPKDCWPNRDQTLHFALLQ